MSTRNDGDPWGWVSSAGLRACLNAMEKEICISCQQPPSRPPYIHYSVRSVLDPHTYIKTLFGTPSTNMGTADVTPTLKYEEKAALDGEAHHVDVIAPEAEKVDGSRETT